MTMASRHLARFGLQAARALVATNGAGASVGLRAGFASAAASGSGGGSSVSVSAVAVGIGTPPCIDAHLHEMCDARMAPACLGRGACGLVSWHSPLLSPRALYMCAHHANALG